MSFPVEEFEWLLRQREFTLDQDGLRIRHPHGIWMESVTATQSPLSLVERAYEDIYMSWVRHEASMEDGE